jgi:hypothetical protein
MLARFRLSVISHASAVLLSTQTAADYAAPCPPPCRGITLFSWTGRPLPLRAWLLYTAAVVAAVLALVWLVPGYKELAQLQGLQLPVMALGGCCCSRWRFQCQGQALE